MKGNTYLPNALTNQAQILTTRKSSTQAWNSTSVCHDTVATRPDGGGTHTHTHTTGDDTHSRIGDASCEHVQKCEERAVAVQSSVLGKRREGVMVVCTGGEEVVSWCGGGLETVVA